MNKPLLLHGQNDAIVDVEHAHRLVLRLETLGKKVEFTIYPDIGHGFDEAQGQIDFVSSIVDFFDVQLAQQ